MTKRTILLITAPVWIPVMALAFLADIFIEAAYQTATWVKSGEARKDNKIFLTGWLGQKIGLQ